MFIPLHCHKMFLFSFRQTTWCFAINMINVASPYNGDLTLKLHYAYTWRLLMVKQNDYNVILTLFSPYTLIVEELIIAEIVVGGIFFSIT